MNTQWIRTLFTFDKKYAPWVLAVLVAGLLAWYWDNKSPETALDPHQAAPADAADTYIPDGFVLVPLEVANYESLDSILGKYGVVDLFAGSSQADHKPVRVAAHIKILRAPLNPSHFAVLAPEKEAANLMAYTGPFTVVVQNPRKSGTEFEKSDSKLASATSLGRGRRSRITVEVPSAE